MLSSEEILQKLYDNAGEFIDDVYQKRYAKATYAYEAARNVALFMELSEEQLAELFGTRQTEEPVIGLYPEELALKSQLQCIIHSQTLQEMASEDIRRREEEWRQCLKRKYIWPN